VRLVGERRGMSEAEVRTLADGSVFTGEQGLANRLVDALGGEREVRRWFEEERGVPKGLEIVDREPQSKDARFGFLTGARAAVFSWIGLDPKSENLGQALSRATGHLDGMVSLWQPPAR
jgi:protease-4